MKQMTEQQLLELLREAFEEGFDRSHDDFRQSDADYDKVRDEKLQKLIDSI